MTNLECLITARKIVDEQAEDEGLWVIPETATERYLQDALMRLHSAIEGKTEDSWKA